MLNNENTANRLFANSIVSNSDRRFIVQAADNFICMDFHILPSSFALSNESISMTTTKNHFQFYNQHMFETRKFHRYRSISIAQIKSVIRFFFFRNVCFRVYRFSHCVLDVDLHLFALSIQILYQMRAKYEHMHKQRQTKRTFDDTALCRWNDICLCQLNWGRFNSSCLLFRSGETK